MFEVIVEYIKEFHVIVRDFSKIDSLIGTLKYGTYHIAEKSILILNQKGSMKFVSGMVEKISEILSFKSTTKQESQIQAKISSIENIKDAKCLSDLDISGVISSIERLKGNVRNSSSMKSEPLIAYFRKLIEFDNKALFELDNLTLGEMDYIVTLMKDKNYKRGAYNAK